METNEIKAGTYLLVAKQWDEHLSKPGEPFDFTRHRRGEVLELNIEDARRLYLARAVLPYDRENPTHAVNADGSVVELLPPDPAATGMGISEEHLSVLSDQLGIPADATSEEIVLAVVRLQEQATASAAAQPPERPKTDQIKDILDWVAGDKDRANLALQGERTTKGDRARPQLVAQLEEIITAPAQGSDG